MSQLFHWPTCRPVESSDMSEQSEPHLTLQNLHLIPVRVGDKRHFAATRGELFPPAGRPDSDAGLLDLVAIADDVVHAEGGVDEVFGAGGLVVLRPSEFEKNVVSRKLEEGELVALGRLPAVLFGVAEFFVKSDGGIKALDADAGVEEADHGEASVAQAGGFAKPGMCMDSDSRRVA